MSSASPIGGEAKVRVFIQSANGAEESFSLPIILPTTLESLTRPIREATLNVIAEHYMHFYRTSARRNEERLDATVPLGGLGLQYERGAFQVYLKNAGESPPVSIFVLPNATQTPLCEKTGGGRGIARGGFKQVSAGDVASQEPKQKTRAAFFGEGWERSVFGSVPCARV
jgi:hypothetical protein